MNSKLDINNLDGQAHEIWRLAEQLCSDHCRPYHQLRGVLMNTSGVRGGRYDADTLEPVIRDLAVAGSRILIAGSADAGLLRTVLHGASARPLSITIVDLCPTPLALIDALQALPGVLITTRTADLTQPLPADLGQFDLIFSHSMLPFVPPPLRALVLASLKGALAQGGRLILSVIMGRKMTGEERIEARQNWFDTALEAVSIDPDMNALAGDAKAQLLRDYANRFRYMEDTFGSPEEIAGLLEACDFEIEQRLYGRDIQMVSAATQGRHSAIFLARS